jgi:hypothetical protein
MGIPVLRKRTSIAAVLLAVTAAASGCSFFQEEDLDFEAEEPRLTEMYHETVRLNTELDAAETRLLEDCMEAQGFTMHDTSRFPRTYGTEQETFLAEAPYERFLPTVEEAERRGFWQWGSLDGAEGIADQELYAEYEAWEFAIIAESLGEEEAAAFMAGDDTLDEFFYLPAEDQYAWYVAFGGDTWATYHYPELGGPGRKTDASGEEVHTNPPPEGCLRETIEAVYGELRSVPNEEEGWNDWISRPTPPVGDWEAMDERYTERTADAEADLLDCLEDRGSTGWEFNNGALPIREYLVAAGETVNPADKGTETTGPWPEIPDEVPDVSDVEGWLAFERDLAVDVAECGDESGFRDTAEKAWQQAQLRFHLDIEDETYAWQEEMRGYLETAQEVIGE